MVVETVSSRQALRCGPLRPGIVDCMAIARFGLMCGLLLLVSVGALKTRAQGVESAADFLLDARMQTQQLDDLTREVRIHTLPHTARTGPVRAGPARDN